MNRLFNTVPWRFHAILHQLSAAVVGVVMVVVVDFTEENVFPLSDN